MGKNRRSSQQKTRGSSQQKTCLGKNRRSSQQNSRLGKNRDSSQQKTRLGKNRRSQQKSCVTVSYDHQGVNDSNKPNTQQYIAPQTGADVRCEAAQAPTFGWQPSSRNLADKHPTVRR